MSLLFSYLNSVRYNLVVELCREGSREKSLKVFLLWFFLLFPIMHIFTFIYPEISKIYGSLK